jgi:hypothetical protein
MKNIDNDKLLAHKRAVDAERRAQAILKGRARDAERRAKVGAAFAAILNASRKEAS